MNRLLILCIAWAAVGAGCGEHSAGRPTETASAASESGELRVAEVRVPGSPVPIEGEISYIRVRRVGGATIANTTLPYGRDPLRLRVTPGRYAVSVWHRLCDGNCGTLDAASDRCQSAVDVRPNAKLLVTIQNSPGSPCRIVTRSVEVRSSLAAPARSRLAYSNATLLGI